MKIFRKLGLLILLLAISLVLFIYSYPYIIFGSSYVFGFPSDKISAIWDFWWRRNAESLGYKPYGSPLVEYPWIVNFSGLLDQHLYLWLRGFLGIFFDELNLFNILLFLVILVSLTGTFYLLKFLTKNIYSGLFAGVAFATSQYLYWHATQNIEISLAAAGLSFFLLLLFRLEDSLDRKSLKEGMLWSFFSGVLFMAVFLTSYYVGYFALISLVGFFTFNRLVKGLLKQSSENPGRALAAYLMMVLPIMIFSLPLLLTLVSYWRGGSVTAEASFLDQLYGRSHLNDLIAYGARPWDYLLPSPSHPIFGSSVTQFYQSLRDQATYQYWSAFLPERPNYLSLAVLAPALFVISKLLRSFYQKDSSFSDREKTNILMLLLFSVWMFLVSLPAIITFRGISFYMPAYFLFKIFPEFRVYARAGIFVLLGMTALAGYGLKIISVKKNSFGRLAVFLSFSGLVLFENLNLTPVAAMDVKNIPQVYQWLERQKEDLMIVEYPKDNSGNDLGGGCPSWFPPEIVRDYNRAYELFYFRIHRKKLFGYSHLQSRERSILGNLNDQRVYEILKKNGVTTLIIHTKDPMVGTHPWPYPQDNPLDSCWRRRIMKAPEKVYEGFVKVAEFDDGVIYRVN